MKEGYHEAHGLLHIHDGAEIQTEHVEGTAEWTAIIHNGKRYENPEVREEGTHRHGLFGVFRVGFVDYSVNPPTQE